MVIVSAANEAFIPHFAALLHSAWTNNREAEFYLLDCGISAQTRQSLSRFCQMRHIDLHVRPVDMNRFADLPTHVWSIETYARLAVSDVLPTRCRKALYIDADCIVTASLSELWSVDISQHLIAAVRDRKGAEAERVGGGLGACPDFANTGVMLVNLDAWRVEGLGARALDYARERTVVHAEQSAINALAAGRVRIVADTWNFMLHYERSRHSSPVMPSIVHFTGPRKPWIYCDEYFAEVYRYHRNQTPFRIDHPLRRYRSRFRVTLNLLALRKSYWRRLRLSRHYRRQFTVPYLADA